MELSRKNGHLCYKIRLHKMSISLERKARTNFIMKLFASILLTLSFSQIHCAYVPGTPGGPWTLAEMLVVKARLYNVYKRFGAPTALRLAFHDCIKYADGTGGCDGCLNWSGVDVTLDAPVFSKQYDDVNQTNNNGLGPIVRVLEGIYQNPCTWGTVGNPCLGQSLFASGKSRADFWAFAAIVAVEYGMETNNVACSNTLDKRIGQHPTCIHDSGPNCKIQPQRTFQFQYGRVDCKGSDPAFPYKTNKPEHHPDPVADGTSTVNFFKDNFAFNGRETVAIFGAHTFGVPTMTISLFPYTWTSSATNLFNNDYYKSMTGQNRWFFDDDKCTALGDAYGNKPITRWKANARKLTKSGGPIFWMKENLVCPDMYNTYYPLDSFDKACVKAAGPGMTCKADPAVLGSTIPRTRNQTDADYNIGCERFRFIIGRDEIALNCELGLYLNFTVNNGIISGCPGFEDFNAEMQRNNSYFAVSREYAGGPFGEPRCGKQFLSEPAGSTPTYQIMEMYANNQSTWINDFIPTMEKMMRNGYSAGLNNAPDHNANVFCPIPVPTDPNDNTLCYQKSPATGPSFMIGNRLSNLDGRVYQYNLSSGIFDFGLKTGAANQMWKFSVSQSQVINQYTNLPLVVDSNVEWTFDFYNGDVVVINPLTSKVIDCYSAGVNLGKACITSSRWNGGNQLFYQILN